MPNYDFKCARGHFFERFVPLVDFDKSQLCPKCGQLAKQVGVYLCGFGTASPVVDEKVYREHNVTRTTTETFAGDGFVTKRPIAPSEQCQCGNCGSHRKRAAMTAVADPRKEV